MVNMRTTHRLQCDMFSVGVMAYALISGCLPFYSEDQGTLQHLIMSSEPSYEEEVQKRVRDEGVGVIPQICLDLVRIDSGEDMANGEDMFLPVIGASECRTLLSLMEGTIRVVST